MEMKAPALLGLAMMLAAAAPPAHPRGNNRQLRFIDLTGEFDRAWTKTKDVPDNDRVEAFEAEFAEVLPGFYSAKRVGDFITPDHYHDMVLKGLKDYPTHRPGIQRVSSQFSRLIAPARRDFETRFGPLRGYPPIYLVNSFGEFDGGTRDLPEGNRLMFGADMIDKLYQGRSMKPFFEHELFHLMHARTFKQCDAVWCNLWEEGLATYVASTLNPGADDAELGLTVPQPIRGPVEANKAAAIGAVVQRLDSTKPEDYAPLFYGSRKLPNLPARFGYYVGYLVVQDIGRTHDLKQLAALQPNEVRPLIIQSLDRLAHSP
jgi:hypothetical protein